MMRKLDIPATADQLASFIRASVTSSGFENGVVAVSGGVDSATATALAVSALGRDNVFALLLPYRDWHVTGVRLARQLLEQLQIPPEHVVEINIAPLVDASVAVLGLDAGASETDRLRLGNIMARLRMITLFDAARKLSALVVGTENKSEHYLGYYTRFGDEASDIEPLRNLYKMEIYQLAAQVGVTQGILDATPSAGLWAGQSDESEFGFSYQAADEVLHGLFDAGLSASELVKRGQDKQTVDGVTAWVERVGYKHHLPILAPEPVVVE